MVNRVQSKIGFKNMTTQRGTLGALFLTAISESPLSQVVWCNVVPEEAEVASEFVGEAFSSSGPPRGQRGTGPLQAMAIDEQGGLFRGGQASLRLPDVRTCGVLRLS